MPPCRDLAPERRRVHHPVRMKAATRRNGPATSRQRSPPSIAPHRAARMRRAAPLGSVRPVPFARPESLRAELADAFPDRPFRVEFWDGTSLPAPAGDGPLFAVRTPVAIAHALRAPGQLGLGRAYVAGAL